MLEISCGMRALVAHAQCDKHVATSVPQVLYLPSQGILSCRVALLLAPESQCIINAYQSGMVNKIINEQRIRTCNTLDSINSSQTLFNSYTILR